MAVSAAPPANGLSLAERLRGVRVGLRPDLEVSRHVYRGTPCYILRDPVTFQSHRVDLADYRLLIRLDASRTLGEIFVGAVADGLLGPDDEEVFYRFVFTLHRCGFLSLPVSDERLLYRRHRARLQAERRRLLTGWLALRIPLINPDAFLGRTLAWGRLLFTRWFFALWLMLIAGAVGVVAARWSDFLQPIHGLLAAHNLPLLWLTLVGLKICHEFGHAYACKQFGGAVPEMGVYLILLTPCAYVDASAAWGFPRRRDRLIVSLAGIYVELAVAAVAVFVWAATGPSLLHAAAYNAIFLASVVTVLFNANPLLRYDGYYVLSDLLEVPNLRARAAQAVVGLLKRVFLGLPAPAAAGPLRLRALLVGFGAASAAYRLVVLLAIAALIVSRSFYLGVLVGLAFVTFAAVRLGRDLLHYLWFASETASVRRRAVACSAVLMILLPAGLALVPVPSAVHAAGTLRAEHECVVRAVVPGVLEAVAFEPHDAVAAGQTLAELSNPALEDELAQACAALTVCEVRQAAYEPTSPALAQAEAARARHRREELAYARERHAALVVTAPAAGRVVAGVRRTDLGRFVREGEPLATLVAGPWQVCAVLTADEFAAAQPAVGDAVAFRPVAAPHEVLRGVVVRVGPAASRDPGAVALTHLAGGAIAVDPQGRAEQPYVHVVATLEGPASDAKAGGPPLAHGMTGTLRLRAAAEPLGVTLYRHGVRFFDRLQAQ